MDRPKFYKPLTRIAVDSTNYYKPPTCFNVVKTDYPNYYKLPTCFAVVKTDPSNVFKPPTRFAVVKPGSPNFYELLTRIHGLLQASYTLFGRQNGLSELFRRAWLAKVYSWWIPCS